MHAEDQACCYPTLGSEVLVTAAQPRATTEPHPSRAPLNQSPSLLPEPRHPCEPAAPLTLPLLPCAALRCPALPGAAAVLPAVGAREGRASLEPPVGAAGHGGCRQHRAVPGALHGRHRQVPTDWRRLQLWCFLVVKRMSHHERMEPYMDGSARYGGGMS